MKKKLERIQRWLNRLCAACESRRWDSAIAEADCLDAEVRELRKSLCSLLNDPEAAKRGVFTANTVGMSIKSMGIALFIVLASTIPLAVEADKPWVAVVSAPVTAEKNNEHLSWVTEEEDQLLQVLRADLSGKNKPFAMSAGNFPGTTPVVASAARKSVKKTETLAVKNEIEEKPDALVTNEDILALIQIGEKALRGRDSAIKIVN